MEPTPMMAALLVVGLVCLFFSFAASVDFLLRSDKRLQAFLMALAGFFFFTLAMACVIATYQGKSYRTVSGLLCFFNAVAFGLALVTLRNLRAVAKPDNLIAIASGLFLSALGFVINGLGALIR